MIKKTYRKVFAGVYDPFMRKFEARIMAKRRLKLLGKLKGKILDVGSGTGVNFSYFSESTEIIAVEPSREMIAKAKKKYPAALNIEIINKGINELSFDNHSFDAIICTLVLCTIPDPELALFNFKKWLKPDGRLIIIEHIHASSHFRRRIYEFANPFWKVLADGCNLNRSTKELILKTGFKTVHSEDFKVGLDFHQGIYTLKN